MFTNSKRIDITNQLIRELREGIKKRDDKALSEQKRRGMSLAEWNTVTEQDAIDESLIETLAKLRETLPRPLQERGAYFSGKSYIRALELLVPYITAQLKLHEVTSTTPEQDQLDQLYRWVMDKLHLSYWTNQDPRFNSAFLIPKEEEPADPAQQDRVTKLPDREELPDSDLDVPAFMKPDPTPTPA